MMKTQRTGIALMLLVLAATGLGCGGDDDDAGKFGGTGGTAGSSTGGTGGTAGSSTGGTGGTAGSSTGGTGGSATGGTGGSAGTGGGSGGTTATGGSGGAASEPAPIQTLIFAETDAIFPNPERGFHGYVDLATGTDFDWLAAKGIRIARSYVRIDDYRNSPIPESLLDDLGVGFEAARSAGIKVVPRFTYNFGYEEDAPLARVLEHIEQVEPVLQANADVIAALHAGFIGAWGEWHSSTNNLTTPENSRQIAEALLDALPPSRMIQVRYPVAKEAMWGAPLTAEEAYNGSYKARTGHLNDCFLCNETDAGTYPWDDIETYKDFVAAETLYTPLGGETCQIDAGNQRGDCVTTLEEMERLHWSYINFEFFEPAVQRWRDEGCYDTIDRRLGYRFRLLEADVPPEIRPGGQFALRVQLHNDGFGSVYNARPVFVVLDNGSQRYEVELKSVDARRWAAGQDASFSKRIELPAEVPEGTYVLALWLPDEAEHLRANPLYSIRFAHDTGWDASNGYQVLGDVRVGDDAPGTSNPNATGLSVLNDP